MRRRTLTLVLAAASLAVLASLTSTATAASPTVGDERVCAQASTGHAACLAHVRTKGARRDATTTRGRGYISADLRAAYHLTGTTSSATVAIVDAYANPNAASDLAAYRAATNLPVLTSGQFRQINQTEGEALPRGNVGWGQEEMLDLEMVSAICPRCNIVYVAGNSNSFMDLATAVDTAAGQGVVAISNSYGGSEFPGESTLQSHFNHPGIAVTVSSGDSGYGVEFPAASRYVIAVGGTTLQRNTSTRGFTERAWSGAGSGCSAYITKPTWQKDTRCARRTVADVSAVADPATGVAVYDSYGSTGDANWYVFGGTSVAAPIIAGVYALSGNTAGYPALASYTNRAALYDVTSGANTPGCRFGYLCSSVTGYDGPTGNGTPYGTKAF